jgi:Contractile injection system tube protein
VTTFSKPVTKGRVTLMSGVSRPFLINPETLTWAHGWSWGRQKPLGSSHPVLSGGSGTDEEISCTLILDGDRGRLEERRLRGSTSCDIMQDVSWFRSLVLPSRSTMLTTAQGSVAGATPPRFTFTFGDVFTRGSCVMESVKLTAQLFTRDLVCYRATLDIRMLVSERVTLFAEDVYLDEAGEETTDLSATLPILGGLE